MLYQLQKGGSMKKLRKKHIPNGVSNEKIREYMISNNFVYEGTLDSVFKAIMGSCLLYLGDIISKLTGLDKDFIIKNFKEQNVEYKIANALERKKYLILFLNYQVILLT